MPEEINIPPADQPASVPTETIPAPPEIQTPPPAEPAPAGEPATSPAPEPPTTPQPPSTPFPSSSGGAQVPSPPPNQEGSGGGPSATPSATPTPSTPQIPSTFYPPSEEPVTAPSSPSPAPSSVPQQARTIGEKFIDGMVNWKKNLVKAMAKRQERKQANLDKILQFAQAHGTVTNKQAQKIVHCRKLTTWRYLKTLEKQGKLRRTGGHNVATYEIIRKPSP